MIKSWFYIGAVFVALTMSSGAYANAELDKRLNKELSEFKEIFTSSSGPELIRFSNLLTGSGVNDEELYKIVENRLRSIYETHLNAPRDKNVAKELNAVMRAYGAFGNPASISLITDLQYNSKSRGVRNRAIRLIPKIHWFGKRNELMNNKSRYISGQKLISYRLVNLVLDGGPKMKRWAAEELNRRGGADKKVYEAMRTVLKDYDIKKNSSPVTVDAMAWFCKTLARFDLSESRNLLTEIKASDKYDSKIKKYARF